MNHRRTQLLSVLITFLVVFGSFNTLFVQVIPIHLFTYSFIYFIYLLTTFFFDIVK